MPNGGWLDGALGVLAGIEALRRYKDPAPPVTLAVVDFADEEGARFSRSLLGSSGASGSLVPDLVRGLLDRQGVRLADALAENGVEVDRMLEARRSLDARHPRAYLELHIEQGPVLEAMGRSTGAVIGAYGVERHVLRFVGQAAHAGSTPITMRRDAFLAAAETALACREIARRHSTPTAGMVCTVGTVSVEPAIVTAVPGVCEIALDQRAIDPDTLGQALADAREAAARAAAANGVAVEWRHVWRIDPCRFDARLVDLCAEAVQEATGHAPRLPSGPLHDAVEMSRVMPAVMMFARSSNGLSHCKEEDTPEADLEVTIDAFLRLVDKTMVAVAAAESSPGDFVPRTPLHTRSRGPRRPAPLVWLTRYRSFAILEIASRLRLALDHSKWYYQQVKHACRMLSIGDGRRRIQHKLAVKVQTIAVLACITGPC